MKIGSGIYICKRLAGLQFDFEFTVADLYFIISRRINTKQEKKGIENHKRNVWDMCGKYADCKHDLYIFSLKTANKGKN